MSFAKLPVLRHGLMTRDRELLADSDVAGRIAKTRQLMLEKDVNVLLVYSDPTNNGPVCYLTNYPCFGMGRRATAVLGREDGPFLFTAEPSRNLPRVRLFTTCDLEKTRQFMSAAVERAKKLAGKGRIGLVGLTNMPAGVVKDAKGLDETETADLSPDFARLMAAQDASARGAQQRSQELAEQGLKLITELAATGKDLWEIAATVDHRLRLAGCEDTNILLNCSAGGPLRPAYPDQKRPLPGDMVVAYLAVQCARLWGVIGDTLAVGTDDSRLRDGGARLGRAQNKIAAVLKAGMTLGEAEAAILTSGREAGLALAQDVPLVTGTGFDLHEYPLAAEDLLDKDAVLQVALTVDFPEGYTGMVVDLLQVREKDSRWLTGKNEGAAA